jgi:Holliday junction resolvase RusA-like endonuclease
MVHGRPRTLISKRGRQYKEDVQKIAPTNPLDGRLSVEILLSNHTKRKYDVDNYSKALLDSLIGFAYIDDEQIDDLRITRLKSGHGKAIVNIKALE